MTMAGEGATAACGVQYAALQPMCVNEHDPPSGVLADWYEST